MSLAAILTRVGARPLSRRPRWALPAGIAAAFGQCRRAVALAALVVGVAGAVAGADAAPLQRNLGGDLVYFRLRALPADLPADAALQQHPAIVDLRYTQADAAAATVFSGWLKFHARPRQPIFILVNAATAPALLATLHEHETAGALTIGNAGRYFPTDIPVSQSAADERRAYDALEDGSTVAALITDNPGKVRNDEASLAHPPTDTADGAVDTDTPPIPAPAKPATLTDAALQKAVQLDRGLKALKAF